MGKANVDPAEMRRFAKDLNQFTLELQQLMAGLRSKLAGLEATWQDQEQRKFMEAFAGTYKVLEKFSQDATQHVSVLGKKASAIEEYLKQR